MSRESYVSYETAKLLKEKGFDWVVDTYYCDDYDYAQHDIIEYKKENYNSHKVHISAPTQQMACRWLRETYGLWVVPMPCLDGGCHFKIYKCYGKVWRDNVYDYTDYEDFDEPEGAVEAALEYCLTNLI